MPIFEIKFQQVISCARGLYMSRPLANYLLIFILTKSLTSCWLLAFQERFYVSAIFLALT